MSQSSETNEAKVGVKAGRSVPGSGLACVGLLPTNLGQVALLNYNLTGTKSILQLSGCVNCGRPTHPPAPGSGRGLAHCLCSAVEDCRRVKSDERGSERGPALTGQTIP